MSAKNNGCREFQEEKEEEPCAHLEDVQLDLSNSDTFSGFTENSNFPLVYEVYKEKSRKSIRYPRVFYKRVIEKHGRLNIFQNKIPKKQLRYIRDLGNTLINTRWRWILLSLFLANAVSYVFFAFMWMAVGKFNGDEHEKDDTKKCIVGTHTFAGYLLLSIETLTTIGFGEIYPTDCHEGWVILTLQAMVGVAIEGALVAAVYVKLSRPHAKDKLDIFSKKAVVSLRDDELCLIFRIGDSTGKFWTKTDIKAYFCGRRLSPEGEDLQNYFVPLKLQPFGELFWPVEVVHVIDDSSPLWDFSARDLLIARFEIMVVICGDSISTGQPSQTQTSYLSSEIQWGYRFVSCTRFDDEREKYIVDCKKFNTTTASDIPLCSAKRLKEVLEDISSSSRQAQSESYC